MAVIVLITGVLEGHLQSDLSDYFLGANQGIGFETAKNLLLSSDKYVILIGSRDLANGQQAASTLNGLVPGERARAIQIDVTNDVSVDAAAALVDDTYGRLDILVNNAGIGVQAGSLRDSMRAVFDVNVFGVVSVTEAFIPLLKNSSSPRLIFVSSTTGSINMASDPKSPLHGGGAMEYRSSKATLNMLMVLYANRLGGAGFKVHGANPGLIATNFHGAERTRKPGAEPEVGGARIASVVKGERDADVGKVVGPIGENGILPW